MRASAEFDHYAPLATTQLAPSGRAPSSARFGIVVLELLTGKPGLEVANRLLQDGWLEAIEQHVDARAGAWPAEVVAGLAEVVQRCTEWDVKLRASVQGQVATLDALSD